MTINQALDKLSYSKFRSSFHLTKAEKAYVMDKGLAEIRNHAKKIIEERLSQSQPRNDGKQTPMKGHPVFKAQHACGCCCRGCLNKWYNVPKGVELTNQQQEKIVNLLLAWIEREMEK